MRLFSAKMCCIAPITTDHRRLSALRWNSELPPGRPLYRARTISTWRKAGMSRNPPRRGKAKAAEPVFDGIANYPADDAVESMLQALLERFRVQPLDGVKNFPIYVRRTTVKWLLAPFQLFLKAVS